MDTSDSAIGTRELECEWIGSDLAVGEELAREVAQAVGHCAVHDGLAALLRRLEEHARRHAQQVAVHAGVVAQQVCTARACTNTRSS